MTEVGIKMSNSIAAGVDDLPCFMAFIQNDAKACRSKPEVCFK